MLKKHENKQVNRVVNMFPDLFTDTVALEWPKGWNYLITNMCMQLDVIGGVKIHEIKEKFGTLRVRTGALGEHDTVCNALELIRDYENHSDTMCAHCATTENIKRIALHGFLLITICNTCEHRYKTDPDWKSDKYD